MMAKDVRNLIISLFIIAVGIKLILNISAGFISQVQVTQVIDVPPLEGIGNLFIFALAIFMLVLVPVYLSKRREEHKQAGNYSKLSALN